MESFSEFLNLANISSISSKTLLLACQHCINHEGSCFTTEEVKLSLIKNLPYKPYETMVLIRKLQAYDTTANALSSENIFIPALFSYLEICEKNEETDVRNMYTVMGVLTIFQDRDIIHKLFTRVICLIKQRKIKNEIVYLTLLPHNRTSSFKKLLMHENSCVSIDWKNKTLLCYSLHKSHHWLFHVIEKAKGGILVNEVPQKIYLTGVIDYTNKSSIRNIYHVAKAFHGMSKDKYLYFYMENVMWNLEVSRIILKFHHGEMKKSELSSIVLCLHTLIITFNIDNYEIYSELNKLLKNYQSYKLEIAKLFNHIEISNNLKEVDIYNSFCMLSLVKYFMENNLEMQSVHHMMKVIKSHILECNNVEFVLETYENIYMLSFRSSVDENFLCERYELQFLTNYLKSALKELKKKYFSQSAGIMPAYKRYCTLNNYLNDTLWRLDLLKILNINASNKQLLKFMFASSETLIFYCLEKDNFDKANEVVQMFNLQDTCIFQEIEFMEKMHYMKSKKINHISEIIKHFKESKDVKDEHFEENVHICHLRKFHSTNEYFMNIFDIVLTFDNTQGLCRELLDAALDYKNWRDSMGCHYLKFCSNIIEVFNFTIAKCEVGASDILNDTKFSLNLLEMNRQQRLYEELIKLYSIFDFKNPENCSIYLQLKVLCEDNKFWPSPYKYLGLLFKYLKHISCILDKEKQSLKPVISLFNILLINIAIITGKLLLHNNLKPKDLEQVFTRLEVDLIYHITLNILPNVYLRTRNISKKTKLMSLPLDKSISNVVIQLKDMYYLPTKDKELQLITPDIFLLSYIRKKNWLLAYIINKMYVIEEAKPDTNSGRTKYFNNFLKLPTVECLKSLFHNNISTILFYNNTEMSKILCYIERYLNNSQTQTNRENYNERIHIDWKHLYEIINSLMERTLRRDNNIVQFKEYVLFTLVSSNSALENYKYVEYITDSCVRYQCILTNFEKWPANVCIHVLNSQMTHTQFALQQLHHLQIWSHEVRLYENLRTVFNSHCWNEIYKTSLEDSSTTFHLLLASKQVYPLLKWIDIRKPISPNLLNLINTDYFLSVFDKTNLVYITQLLNILQPDRRINVCKELLRYIKNVEYLKFIVEYVINSLPAIANEYTDLIISLKIISYLSISEREQLYCLVNTPLLIIEHLIMNARLERLKLILEKIKPCIHALPNNNERVISVHKIDKLLRLYAAKLLVFRGVQSAPAFQNLELKLMQSLDSISDETNINPFAIPPEVPRKSEWIQNEQATQCMCCGDVTFSMFNRRHHCRRCGRVVCGNCSCKRLQVFGYDNILVRVCNDCYEHYQQDDQDISLKSQECTKSGSVINWMLTDNERQNDIVREEFSYEYAPSVSLCLSLIKLHSDSVEYPRFLICQCENLLKYLQDAVCEIDYSFVMQMIMSLITVAKMACLNHTYKMELSKCNDILIHAELLNLLIEKDCIGLLQEISKTKSVEYFIDLEKYNIDAGILRRLREKLIEHEQWLLALEVSTKAGLDQNAVFAAWGKSCLWAGSLKAAREKFQHCLEKVPVSETIPDTEDPKSKSHQSFTTLITISENRPSKTPLLINQIVNILQSNYCIDNINVFTTLDTDKISSSTLTLNTYSGYISTDPAISVLSKLQNLQNICSSSPLNNSETLKSPTNFLSKNNYQCIDSSFYQECLHYLMKYASHADILNFYIKYWKINELLKYISDNKVDEHLFIEMYMKCLEYGQMELCHQHMLSIDNSLLIWEAYLISLCRYLEKKCMYNILYELQVFMCDYMRAAITCIKFYEDNCRNFRELAEREEYLQKAQAHLKQELEQEQWMQLRRGRKTSSSSSTSLQSKISIHQCLTMKIEPRNIDKYINTIWRQIEVAKFLAECELENRPTVEILQKIFTLTTDGDVIATKSKIPTLFSTKDKVKLAVLAMVCGKNIEDGFGIAFRIIQDHNLKYLNIYCLVAKYLAQAFREDAVVELVSCIQSSGLSKDAVTETCDELLLLAIRSLIKANSTTQQLDKLTKYITDVGIKVTVYIERNQLKRAYLLAVRHNRNNDIKRILWEAERQNQLQIKRICLKRLNKLQ